MIVLNATERALPTGNWLQWYLLLFLFYHNQNRKTKHSQLTGGGPDLAPGHSLQTPEPPAQVCEVHTEWSGGTQPHQAKPGEDSPALGRAMGALARVSLGSRGTPAGPVPGSRGRDTEG